MIAHALDFYCDLLIIALMLRMIFSLFDPEGEGVLLGFAAFLTEPILILGEKILALFKISNSGPLDMSVFAGYLLLMLIRALLIPILG